MATKLMSNIIFEAKIPTQEEFESLVDEVWKHSPFCYGSISRAADHVVEVFKKLNIDTRNNYETYRAKKSRLWNYAGD